MRASTETNLSLRVDDRDSKARCPLCRSELWEGEIAPCIGCGTGYHVACYEELGGCGVLGCARPRLLRGVTFSTTLDPVERPQRQLEEGGTSWFTWVLVAIGSVLGVLTAVGLSSIHFLDDAGRAAVFDYFLIVSVIVFAILIVRTEFLGREA